MDIRSFFGGLTKVIMKQVSFKMKLNSSYLYSQLRLRNQMK